VWIEILDGLECGDLTKRDAVSVQRTLRIARRARGVQQERGVIGVVVIGSKSALATATTTS